MVLRASGMASLSGEAMSVWSTKLNRATRNLVELGTMVPTGISGMSSGGTLHGGRHWAVARSSRAPQPITVNRFAIVCMVSLLAVPYCRMFGAFMFVSCACDPRVTASP